MAKLNQKKKKKSDQPDRPDAVLKNVFLLLK